MARRLSDEEKREVALHYRRGGFTFASLADHFGISVATVGRILRQYADVEPTDDAPPATTPSLPPPAELRVIEERPAEPAVRSITPAPIPLGENRDRRTRRRSSSTLPLEEPSPAPSLTAVAPDPTTAALANSPPVGEPAAESSGRRRRSLTSRRSDLQPPPDVSPALSPAPDPTPVTAPSPRELPIPQRLRPVLAEVPEVPEGVNPALEEAEEDPISDEFDDDLDGDDLEGEEGFEDDLTPTGLIWGRAGDPLRPIEVLPLTDAIIPSPCYLVVDRAAEPITRPLKDFGELGSIPAAEAESLTLPIFDNHRIARRYSARNDRTVKVPDGQVLHKTGSYLKAKGIDCLLVDGRVYAL